MATKVRPLGDKILVKRAEAVSKTESGIYLPESAKDKPKEGQIVALGNGNLNKETGEYLPFTVKKGDRVIFSSYAGTEIKLDGEEFLIMSEDDILGVIEK
ncbi:MAG TPA: co-chaperone GroES [Phycisphaerales bacterium]|nr:co-chaperone GroES [Phycisphaerales bacterium]HRQ75967.1 co-chaperone GroES [Phycisphaerales bacterium]